MAYTTAQLVTAYTNANLGKAPDAATTLTLDAYASQSQTGGISDAAALANTLKLVNNTTAVAVETYQFFTGRAPSAAGLSYLVNSTTNTNDLNDTYYSKFGQENRFINFSINLATGAGEGAAAFATAYGSVSYAQTVASAYDKIIGNEVAKAAGVDVAAAVAYLSRAENVTYLTNFVKANTTLTAAADIDLAVKAALIGEILNAATVSGLGGYATATTALINDLSDGTLTSDNAAGVNIFTAYPSSGAVGKSFVLTTGADTGATFVGTTGNDTYTAAEVGGNTVFTVGDSVDGGAGVDTLNITQTGAFAMPVGATVSNIEVVNLTTGTSGSVIDTSTWTGVTTLGVIGTGAQTVTAATTTNVTVGDATLGASALSVTGGSAVNVTTATTAGGTIAVSGAAGAVTVKATVNGTGATTQGTIGVTGGTAINITTAATQATNNTSTTQAAITATGGATTTSVTVVEQAAVAAGASAKGIIGGAVTVLDANRTSATKAGTIATVSLTNYGDGSTINSGALTTLNLSGTVGDLGVTTGALTTAAVTTLALNVNAVSKAANVADNDLTIDTDITTLNITSSTKASTFSNVTAAGVTTLNIAGDAKLTLTADTFAALTSVVSTNTAGVTLGTALAAGTAFAGGAGADTITLSNLFTKAITLGAGDDKVTYGGAAGTGGSVVAGDGTDTIVMTGAQAAAASGSAVFNNSFSGFEVLDVTTPAATTINLAGINGVNSVVTRGATGVTLNGYTSGGTLTIDAASTTINANVTNAVLSASDVFNIKVTGAATVAAGTVVATGVETINVTATDTDVDGGANLHTLTISDADATKITVAGNTGINLTNTTATLVTTFDASAHTGDANDGAGVGYTSAYVGASTTSITGGAGNDTLTGASAKDVIVGGAGDDTITGGTGIDTLTGGAGADTFKFASGDAGITGTEKITDYTTGTGGDILDLATTTLIADNAGVTVIGAVGGAVDLTAVVKNGVITLSGADVGLVDTIGEIKAIFELLDTDGAADVGAIQLGNNTYVLIDNGAGPDVTTDIIQLTGVTGITSVGGADGAHAIHIA
ncbi:calcium-binding protein [Caulobacter sp.]|uniref:beta strand repeat-containing protein n=1 Tax=Caulobacter sp. TaxID=78 RepID=UPI001B2C2D57|nr:calcium-binding protein [Caulobacter sp.]MBO9544847.1 calcium-binding protein [Caulobacter sp.]